MRKDITIHDKDVAPVISKTHDDADSTVYVGQKVNFTITGVIPATVGYNEYTYLITDEMTPGLDLDGDITVKVDGVVINDSTVSINKASNKKSFTVTITVSAYSAKVGKDIVVTYSAIVNKNAIERDKETNTVTLKYSNDPNNAESYGYASDNSISKIHQVNTTSVMKQQRMLRGCSTKRKLQCFHPIQMAY